MCGVGLKCMVPPLSIPASVFKPNLLLFMHERGYIDSGYYWDGRPCPGSIPGTGHLFRYVTNQPPKANSAFHPSGVGKCVPASAGKTKAGMVHSVSGCTRGVQVKLWYPLRMRAIPERLRGVFMRRRYTNPRLPLPLPLHDHGASFWWVTDIAQSYQIQRMMLRPLMRLVLTQTMS